MTPEQFMLAEAGKAFRYGETDCAQVCARWVEHRTGINPLHAFGRSYDDEGAASWLSERRLVYSVRSVMRAAGFAATLEPRAGDVGVVASQSFAAVALRGSSTWMFIQKHGGLSSISADLPVCQLAWRIPLRLKE
ncbi:DUF6950 family protein [Brucella pseudogrignonensis]|uniref:DUF6950 family protein n=1 Tax=Brucella pseudogrignonensis TaxID=419475 RepID=UPI003ECEB5C2